MRNQLDYDIMPTIDDEYNGSNDDDASGNADDSSSSKSSVVLLSLLLSQAMYTIANIISASEPNSDGFFPSSNFLWSYRWMLFSLLTVTSIVLTVILIRCIICEIKSMITNGTVGGIRNVLLLGFLFLILEAIVFCPFAYMPYSLTDNLGHGNDILDNLEYVFGYISANFAFAVPIGHIENMIGLFFTLIMMSAFS